jgi:uncharacterized protein YdaU (DUF1376 family)
MNYYKRHIGDYHKKAGRLTMLQHGAYTLLLDACYDREKFPTKAEAIDWCWASNDQEVAAVEFVLQKFFSLDGDRYVQTTISENVTQYQENALKNKQIAIDRENARKLKREQSVHETARTVNESPPNHKPLTNNHEPIEDQKSIDDSGESPAPKIDFVSELFSKFWKHYKNPQGKQKALAKFKLFLKGKTESQARFWMNLMLSYYEHCLENQVLGYDKMHAATYINQKRWEDNPEFMKEFKAEWLRECKQD